MFQPIVPRIGPAHNRRRGVETLNSGPRTRQPCGFFMPAPCGPIAPRRGGKYPEYPPPSVAVSNLLDRSILERLTFENQQEPHPCL